MAYHPTTNQTDLPPVTTVASLDKLPWGGNAWWDLPIITHVNRVVWDTTKPRKLRKALAARSGYLMTGEDCSFATEQEFDDFIEAGQF